MKKFFAIILFLTIAGAAAAQKPAAGDDDKKALEAAVNAPLNADKAALLEKFVSERPKSQYQQSARESLVVARAAYAEELLRSRKPDESFALFSKAVTEAPDPIPDKLFNGAVARFPSVLYWAGQRRPALELAELIEKKVSTNAPQLRSLAMFYLSIENGGRAKQLAESAIAIDPSASASYETLGLAERLEFNFEAAVTAFRKAVELDAANTAAKLSLAEMLRAQSKPTEAAEIYKTVLAETPGDAAASAGLVLSLFDEGKRDEAETLFAEITAENDKNFQLLATVAYWYAANGEGIRAQELAQKSIAVEPRYIWSHIALGKALIAQNDPVGAEKVLVAARRYANIPTLEFEIAAARYKAGFYREAAEELSKSFEIQDGRISTLLGRRIERGSDSFAELVGNERRASIFEPQPGVSAEDDARLKALFAMMRAVDYGEPTENVVAEADKFAAGDDRMNLYRKLYAADVLLDKTDGAAKAAQFAADAIGKTDAALEAPAAGAAVMASELYESRTLAEARGEFLIVPDVPKSTLSAILRGRVEDLAGRALYEQKKYDEAAVRYRRAMTVLPADSAWWRATLWHMGETLQAQGKGRDALDAYVKSYTKGKPDVVKYSVVAALYEQMNGSRTGLETLIGENPLAPTEGGISETKATPTPTETSAAETKLPAFIPAKVPVATEQIAETATPADTKTDADSTDTSKTAESFADVLRTETSNTTEEQPTETSSNAVSEDNSATPAEPTANTETAAVDAEQDATQPETKPEENIATNDRSTTDGAENLPTGNASNETQTPVDETPKESTENVTAETPTSPTEAVSAETKTSVEEISAESIQGAAAEKTETGAKTIAGESEMPVEKKPDSPFEPVVIVVGKTPLPEDPVKIEEPKTNESKPAETGVADATKNEDTAQPTSEDPATTDESVKTENETPPPGGDAAKNSDPEQPLTESSAENKTDETQEATQAEGTRKRIVEGVEIKEKTGETCDVYASQESVSILNDGGNIGILIGIEGVDSKDIRIENSSPEDLQVTLQPDISGFGGRAFFVIRSKTTRTGLYQVTFAGGCGGKTIPVTVR